MGCSSTHTPLAGALTQHPASTPAPCPPLARAPRMYSGFAESVPQEQLTGHMHVVLDVITPIQEALGSAFCRVESACQPRMLTNIEVADLVASSARVRVQMANGAERELTLHSRAAATVSGESDEPPLVWSVDPDSVHALYERCVRGL